MDALAVIGSESRRFYEVAASAEPEGLVPPCPGWSIADLTWHLAEVHWFWATIVERRAAGPREVEADKPPRPTAHPDVIAFGRQQADRLVEVLEATPDDVAVWTWAIEEADHRVGFVRRHQVQEAAIHRWDMEQAASGMASPIDAVAAADAIDEVLAITLPWGVKADSPLGGSVHLHCTDVDGEWLVRRDGSVERVHAKGDAAMRGGASDLLLALYGRVGLDAVEVLGDASLAEDFVARIGTD